jgi:hypothetical protein
MTLHLDLSREVEERLRQEAERRGEPTEAIALQLLEEHLPPALDARRAAAVAMLGRWQVEDAALSREESTANAEVLRALDEARPSYRKLFTAVLPRPMSAISSGLFPPSFGGVSSPDWVASRSQIRQREDLLEPNTLKLEPFCPGKNRGWRHGPARDQWLDRTPQRATETRDVVCRG